MNYYDVFISCLDSHSDGTHSLQLASDVMLHFSKFRLHYSLFSPQKLMGNSDLPSSKVDGASHVDCIVDRDIVFTVFKT